MASSGYERAQTAIVAKSDVQCSVLAKLFHYASIHLPRKQAAKVMMCVMWVMSNGKV